VVIGRSWLAAATEDGLRRLDLADDFVWLEIESAFRDGIRVHVSSGREGGISRCPRPGAVPPTVALLGNREQCRPSDGSHRGLALARCARCSCACRLFGVRKGRAGSRRTITLRRNFGMARSLAGLRPHDRLKRTWFMSIDPSTSRHGSSSSPRNSEQARDGYNPACAVPERRILRGAGSRGRSGRGAAVEAAGPVFIDDAYIADLARLVRGR